MRPLKLTMQAFGSYGEETTVDFAKPDQNLFLITGDTGAGKTTIFDAIVFALYGEASSSANKKEGILLQSQYTDYGREPFVELVFSEGDGEIYTVRRTPRHLKPITRGADKGTGKTREVSGSVSLTMPDGTEYPSKETDGKLREIVGLTKNQFMQVAMIAQGEFMELLRAKSDVKKEIFRKLFNTGLYQDIVNELAERKREKERDLGVLKTQCQTETGRVKIPEDYERRNEIEELTDQMQKGDLSRAGEFMEELGALIETLKKEERRADSEYKKASGARDEKRDALTEAGNLEKLYRKLEEAEKTLKDCEDRAEEIREKEKLAEELSGAFEIQKKYQWMRETSDDTDKIRRSLKENRALLPGLRDKEKKALKDMGEARKILEQEQERFSRISERTDAAVQLFAKIQEAEKRAESCKKLFRDAKEEESVAKKKQEELKAREEARKEEEKNLADAPGRLAAGEAKSREAQILVREMDAFREASQTAETHRKAAEKSQEKYLAARDSYEEARDRYEKMRQLFLDAQAGLLARTLEKGKPCPVCGSLEHPSPCGWEERYGDISEEKLDECGRRKEELQKKQEELAAEAKADLSLAQAKKEDCREKWSRLLEKTREMIPGLPDNADREQTEAALCRWALSAEEEKKECQKEAELLEKLRKDLRKLEEKKKEQEDILSSAGDAARKAERELAAAEAELKSLSDSVEFASREEAQRQKQEAESGKDRAREAYEKAEKEAGELKEKTRETEMRIAGYLEDLPSMEEKLAEKTAEYQAEMTGRGLEESRWRLLTETYREESVERLREETGSYRSSRKAAADLRDSMREAIGNRKTPDREKLEREAEQAEERLEAAESARTMIRTLRKDNEEVYQSLQPRMEERRQAVSEHGRLDALYRMVSGNVSGSRMDLETYVQRYYLERILREANRRFREMSAGQFELRMYGLEKAGEGKNRGLDLMVYSNVTGKEREVRTLSGGESFMAALSLALGMADQIRQSSAAIHLDMMFIDEGFGSLDEHSRNQAVKVLLRMAEGSRLIGIISHVTELKQEIEDQLIVTKDETGSHVRWQIS